MSDTAKPLFDEVLTDDMREEIDELADRFPELPHIDVIEHINDVLKMAIPYRENSVMYEAVIARYNYAIWK